MRVDELVARCAAAAQAADGFQSVRGVFESLRADVASLASLLNYIPGTGGNAQQVFYRSPDLSLLKVCFPVGHRTPPHDHGTWAVILVLSGAEKNTLYVDDAGALRRTGERLLKSGDILPMRDAVAHVAESHGDRPALGLHAYGGDILQLPRRMWHPQTLEAHTLTMDRYSEFASIARLASAAPLAN